MNDTCICKKAKCDRCGEKVKLIHTMKDARRYCPSCGNNMGCTICEGKL